MAIALDEDSLVLDVVILERQALAPVDVEPLVWGPPDAEKAIALYEEAVRARPEDYQSPLLVAGATIAPPT